MNDKLIKLCREFVWVHMYPNHTAIGLFQLRDVVRTFYAGVLETLILVERRDLLQDLVPMYETMCKVDWFPGPEFQKPLEYLH